MSEMIHLLILANSARAGKHCVAGKVVTPAGDGNYKVGAEWIRLADPRDPEGAVPFTNTICQGHGSVRPLDIVKIALQGHCANADHPEDWFFEPGQPWQFIHRASNQILLEIADNPASLWHDNSEIKSVPAGYLQRNMAGRSASLYLVKAPQDWIFSYWKEWNIFEGKNKYPRKLTFTHTGLFHEFSVTDTVFTARHNIFKQATETVQIITAKNLPNAYFCLSLTKLTPEFNSKHYKVCATILES